MKTFLQNQIRENILRLAEAGTRLDKRKPEEYRNLKIETSVLDKCDGSAKVYLGDTEIMVGVVVGLGTPYPDTPAEGAMAVNAELLPLANEKFESGPPRENSIELARVVDRGIRESKLIDRGKLCIKEGEHVRMVFIDMWVLNADGNLIDAAGIASLAALLNTKMKKVKLVDEKPELQEDREQLPLNDVLPVPVTTIKVGDRLLLDATGEEEDAMDARITVSTRKDGAVCAMQKGDEGFFTEAEIAKAIDYSIAKGKEIRKLLPK